MPLEQVDIPIMPLARRLIAHAHFYIVGIGGTGCGMGDELARLYQKLGTMDNEFRSYEYQDQLDTFLAEWKRCIMGRYCFGAGMKGDGEYGFRRTPTLVWIIHECQYDCELTNRDVPSTKRRDLYCTFRWRLFSPRRNVSDMRMTWTNGLHHICKRGSTPAIKGELTYGHVKRNLLLGLGIKTVGEIRYDELPAMRIEKVWRVRSELLEEWMKQKEENMIPLHEYMKPVEHKSYQRFGVPKGFSIRKNRSEGLLTPLCTLFFVIFNLKRS